MSELMNELMDVLAEYFSPANCAQVRADLESRQPPDPAVRILKGENKSTPEFCDECSGPYDGWLAERYGGHWDTCPNRIKGENK